MPIDHFYYYSLHRIFRISQLPQAALYSRDGSWPSKSPSG